MSIIFLDTETTDLDPQRRLVQLAYKNPATAKVVNEYFKPPVPISVGAMSIHHVTNDMVVDKPVFEGSTFHKDLINEIQGNIIVAHNAAFDIEVLKNEGIVASQFIDTLRVARHLVQSEQYKLQYLRYFLNLNVSGVSAHDALGDVLVLEALYEYLKKATAEKFALTSEDAIIQKMIELTNTLVLLNQVGFGKYKGKTFEEVSMLDRAYLDWLRGSETQKSPAEQNSELLFTLAHYCK